MESPQEPFILYHNLWSSRSLMIRLTMLLGEQSPDALRVPVILKEIDIQHGSQLEELYICDVNRMATVPALTHPTLLPAPLTETMDITNLLCEFYPSLCPKQHEAEIKKRMQKLHDISFVTLSFRRWPKKISQIADLMNSRLQDPNISDRYREALKYKYSHQAPEFETLFTLETIEKEDAKAKTFFESLAGIKRRSGNSGSPWLFGTKFGTVLDAHALILLARVSEVGLWEVANPEILAWGKEIMENALWTDFMQGRRTMYSHA